LVTRNEVMARSMKKCEKGLPQDMMKSLASLNGLVTTLNNNVGNLKISLADMKLNLDKVTTDNTATELAVKVARSQTKSNDVILKDVKKANALMRKEVNGTQKDELLMTKMLNDGLQGYDFQIGRLNASIVALKSSSGKAPVGSEIISNLKCAKVCAASQIPGRVRWQQLPNALRVRVPLIGCGFTGYPVITTALVGIYNVKVQGASAVYSVSKTGFTMNLMTKMKVAQAKKYKWSVDFIAVGPTC